MNYLKLKRYSRTGSVLFVSSLMALLSTLNLSAQGMGQQYLMKDWPIAPEQYVEDFNSIHTQVKDNYSLYEQKGIDMDSLYSCYTTKLSAVKCGDDYGNDVVTPFAEKLKEVENLPYLIVDIRRNEGGNSNNGIGLCELLLKKPLQHCLDERTINPQPEAYKGKVYLLIGPRTFSAAESFAIDMMESGEVILIGEPTAGDSGNNPRPFVSKYGIPFIIPTREPQTSRSGFPMEGLGVPPQILIKQTTEDFLMGIDTQLSLTL